MLGLASHAAASLLARSGRPQQALATFRTAIELWRRSGTRPQLWPSIRNLSELLHHLGLADDALILRLAAAASTEAPTACDDADRERELLGQAQAILGPERVVTLEAEASKLSDDEVAQRALVGVDTALGSMAF